MMFNFGNNDRSFGIGHGVLHIHIFDATMQEKIRLCVYTHIIFRKFSIPGIDGHLHWVNLSLQEKACDA